MKKICLLLLLCCVLAPSMKGQKIAVKTNLLYDATSTINAGFEIGLAPQWTLDVSGNYNPWKFSDDKKIMHWMIQPEVRYWLCEKFNGHFFGVHLHGGSFNVGNVLGIKGSRYQGEYYGGGIAYGYQWLLSNRWSIEATVGVGYTRINQEKYDCGKCGAYHGDKEKNYIGPTKAGITLIYVIK